jgi:hypothetical protein
MKTPRSWRTARASTGDLVALAISGGIPRPSALATGNADTASVMRRVSAFKVYKPIKTTMSDSTNQLMDESVPRSRKRRHLDPSRYTFFLTEKQIGTFDLWAKQYEHLNTTAIGGLFRFEFTPTNLGIIVKVKLGLKVDENAEPPSIDLTDYDEF